VRVTGCQAWEERVAAYLDGELRGWRRWCVARHLARCARCAEWAARSQGAVRAFQEAALPPRDEEFVATVMERIRALPPPVWSGAPSRWAVARPAVFAAAGAVALWLVMGPMLAPLRDGREACAQSLRQLARAMRTYMDAHDGTLPPPTRWREAVAAVVPETLPGCPLAPEPSPAAGYDFFTARSPAPAFARAGYVFDAERTGFAPRHRGRGNVLFLPEGDVRLTPRPPILLTAGQ